MYDIGEETSGIEGNGGITRYIPLGIEGAGLGIMREGWNGRKYTI